MNNDQKIIFNKELDNIISTEISSFNIKDLFFTWQYDKPKLKHLTQRIYNKKRSVNYNLYKAIQYEYGIDKEKDEKKAYKYYLLSAYKDKNYISFYYLFILHHSNRISHFYSKDMENEVESLIFKYNHEDYSSEGIESISDSSFKRDFDLQVFYLICSIVYMPSYYFFNLLYPKGIKSTFLMANILDIQDESLKKTRLLLSSLLKNKENKSKFKIFTKSEEEYIKTMFFFRFHVNDDDNNHDKSSQLHESLIDSKYSSQVEMLKSLSNKNFLYATATLAYMYSHNEISKIFKVNNYQYAISLYEKLHEGYYNDNDNISIRFIDEEVEVLFNSGQINKSYDLCKHGVLVGNDRCYYQLYDLEVYLLINYENIDYILNKLSDIYDNLISSFIIGGNYSVFEFIYLKKFVNKYFKYEIPYYNSIIDEIYDVYTSHLEGKYSIIVNDQLLDYLSESYFIVGYILYVKCYNLYMLSIGKSKEESKLSYLDYFFKKYKYFTKGNSRLNPLNEKEETCLEEIKVNLNNKIESLMQINENSKDNLTETVTEAKESQTEHINYEDCYLKLRLSFDNLNKALQICKSLTHRRFILSFMNKVLQLIINLHESKLVTNKDNIIIQIKETQKDFQKFLYTSYYDSIEHIQVDSKFFSSSFFYQYAKLYKEGIGTSQNEYMFIKYSLFALYADYYILGNGTILLFTRRIKSYKLLEDNSLYCQIKESLEKEKVLKEKNESNCIICFERQKEVIFYPCLHYICCSSCFKRIVFKSQCPLCRRKIVVFI